MKKWRLAVVLCVTTVACAQSTVPGTFWGTHFNHQSTLSTSTYPSTLTFNTVRLWDTGTGWYEMQSGAACDDTHTGGCNFTNLDAWMSVLPSGVDVILTVGKTPYFISSDQNHSCNYNQVAHCVPPTDVSCSGGGTDTTFTGFMQALWNHMLAQSWYSGRQWYVEIWNEPNNAGFWDNSWISSTLCPSTTDAPQKILLRMAQDARTAVLLKDSTVKFLTPPVANALTEVKSGGWWYKYLNDGGGSSADVMSVHGYLSGSVDQICCGTNTLVNLTLATMSTFGFSSYPLFISEGSYGQSAPSDPAAWTARYYTLMLSQGQVARFAWYNYDSSPAKLWTGPNANDFTTTGTALNVLQGSWGYVGATFAAGGCASTSTSCTGSGHIRSCSLTEGGSGKSALVAWYDSGGNTCSYTPSGSWSRYRDLSGTVHTYSGGAVTLTNSPIEFEQ